MIGILSNNSIRASVLISLIGALVATPYILLFKLVCRSCSIVVDAPVTGFGTNIWVEVVVVVVEGVLLRGTNNAGRPSSSIWIIGMVALVEMELGAVIVVNVREGMVLVCIASLKDGVSRIVLDKPNKSSKSTPPPLTGVCCVLDPKDDSDGMLILDTLVACGLTNAKLDINDAGLCLGGRVIDNEARLGVVVDSGKDSRGTDGTGV